MIPPRIELGISNSKEITPSLVNDAILSQALQCKVNQAIQERYPSAVSICQELGIGVLS